MSRKRSATAWSNHLLNFLSVILGVYLAFFLNDRADRNRDRKEGQVLMESLAGDLAKDIEQYGDYQIPVNRQHVARLEGLLDMLQQDSVAGIGAHLGAIFEVENYAATTATYAAMRSSGKLGLIGDPELRKELADHYEGLAVESIRKGEYQVDYFTNELLPWLTLNMDLATMQLLKEDELTVLKNKLIIYGSLVEQKVGSYEAMAESSEALRERIASVLGAR